ncbi:MAG: hypothetical protein M3460_23175 [Actinomycetota bacterium]|nr:hypothetical protein [Actinomycetota bacterium]
MSAQPPGPSSLPQHIDTGEQHETELSESTPPPRSASNSLPDSSSTDLSMESAVKSGEKGGDESPAWISIFRGIGESIAGIVGIIIVLVVWLMVSAIILGIIGFLLGKPTQGPEFDEFFDQHWWKAFLGTPVLVVIVLVAVYGVPWLLTRRRERIMMRERVLTERAKALQTMVREAQEVSRELERYLGERLAALEALNTQMRDKEHLAKLTPDQVKALDEALRRQFIGHRRSELIKQVVFLILAFVLGFIVNWLSTPVLDELRHWWAS